jgi:predicted nucleic acid-binding protein
MRVFVDTSVFMSLFITNEITHEVVSAKYQEYRDSNAFFYTNYFVLSELYTRVLYDVHASACRRVVKSVNALVRGGGLQVLDVDAVLFSKAEKAMVKFSEHKMSLVDATIFACVKLYKLDEVFTLDKDFRKIGLKTSF